MSNNNEVKAKVKEKTTASIEFSDVSGMNDGTPFDLQIVPVSLDTNAANTTIKVIINYYSAKIAHTEGNIIGTYEVKANIYSNIIISTKDFVEIMRVGRKSLGELSGEPILSNDSVEVVELNPIKVRDDSVGLDAIKTRIEQKLLLINQSILNDVELSISILQQDYEVEK